MRGSGSKSSDPRPGSYDVMSQLDFDGPRGMDITPLLSVASPRPGTTISGVRTLRVIVRDPDVVEVEFRRGPNSLCTDSHVLDGIAECSVDLSGWSSGQHIVKVVATTSGSGEYFIRVPYDIP